MENMVTNAIEYLVAMMLQGVITDSVADEEVFTTLEIKMKCGVGKCGRCNIGPKYVCKDGPVFRLDALKALPQEY